MDDSKTPSSSEGLAGLDPARLMALADEARSIAAAAEEAAPRADRPSREPWPVERVDAMFAGLDVVELVGSGGMGAVYRARQRGLERDVALKLLHPELASEPGLADRFTREARALASLSHANIVAVHDVGVTDGVPWLVMEYVPGVTLRAALRTGELSGAAALSLVGPMCDALQYAHDAGVVHRDIKPENVLLDGRGGLKIADFGLAKLLGADDDHALTQTHQVMGTPRYMAPEQFDSPRDVDHRADIYSLGVVVYEMLTGHVPAGRFVPPSLQTAVDARVDEIVMRALEREPWQRYQQAADVKTDVDALGSAPPQQQRTETIIEGRPWTKSDQREEWRDVGQLALASLVALFGVGLSAQAFALGPVGLVACGAAIALAYGAWSVARLRKHEPRLAEGWRAKSRAARMTKTTVAAVLAVLAWLFATLGTIASWEDGIPRYVAPEARWWAGTRTIAAEFTDGVIPATERFVTSVDPFDVSPYWMFAFALALGCTAGAWLLDMRTPGIRRTRELLLAWTPALGASVALLTVGVWTTIAWSLDQPWPLYEVAGDVVVDAPVVRAHRDVVRMLRDEGYEIRSDDQVRRIDGSGPTAAEIVAEPRWPTERWDTSDLFVLRAAPTLRVRLLPSDDGGTRVEWSAGSYPEHNGDTARVRRVWAPRFDALAD